MLRRTTNNTYSARPVRYTDDLQFFALTLPGLQDKANLVSLFAMVFELTIAVTTNSEPLR